MPRGDPAWPQSGARDATPSVRAERCVHSLCEQARCRACVTACPTGAWSLDDDQLGIDPDRCDGCGLCVAACPQQALDLPLQPLLINLAGRRAMLLACDRIGAAERLDGIVPCVHAISLRRLTRYTSERVSAVIYSTGDCTACPRGGAKPLEQHLRRANRILNSRHLPHLSFTRLAPRDWLELRARHATVSTGRRRFLVDGLSRLAQSEREPTDPDRAHPQTATTALDAPGTGLAEWRPHLDPQRCDGCGACFRLCPTDALRHDRTANLFHVTPDACTGCGLCGDVCERDAITTTALGAAKPYSIALEPRRCRACGVTFPVIEAAKDDQQLCPICREVNHYRRLYQVLDGDSVT